MYLTNTFIFTGNQNMNYTGGNYKHNKDGIVNVRKKCIYQIIFNKGALLVGKIKLYLVSGCATDPKLKGSSNIICYMYMYFVKMCKT